jgi:hypothetical protein
MNETCSPSTSSTNASTKQRISLLDSTFHVVSSLHLDQPSRLLHFIFF